MTLYSRLKKAYAYSRDIQKLVDRYRFVWETKDSAESQKIIKNALEALEDFETNYDAHPDLFEEHKAELAKTDAEVEAEIKREKENKKSAKRKKGEPRRRWEF